MPTIMKTRRGFTLMELMIVVAVIAILAGVAIYSYGGQVRKGRRAAAQADLAELSQYMERLYTNNDTYCAAADCAAAPTLPFTVSPRTGGSKFYDLTVSTPAPETPTFAPTFTLTATPVAGSDQAKDKCGTMTLTHAGAKTANSADCWR
jgi:type IV pilus assembly protein PilE